jgi:hypothetical protein
LEPEYCLSLREYRQWVESSMRCILLDLDRDQRTAEVRPSREATPIARWALARVNREEVDRGVVAAKIEEE